MNTIQQLKTMQAYPLERKIQIAQTRIFEWYMRHSGQVYVSFSGGKDSAVLLDIVRRCYPGVEAVYVDTGLDFPEVKALAKNTPNVTVLKPKMRFDEVVGKYGWCYPSKDVAMSIYYARRGSVWAIRSFEGVNNNGTPSLYRSTRYVKWKFLIDSPFLISHICCGVMKERPLDVYAKSTGKLPFVGTLATESHRRRVSWQKTGCNAYDTKRASSKPLSIWTEHDILSYIRRYNVPIASVYGDIVNGKDGKLRLTGEQRTGCVFCPIGCHLHKENKFERLAKSHPNLHEYCMGKLGLGEFLDFIGVKKGER